MKIGIMQPYFFPYIGYWQLINCVDEFIIYDDVNYIKKGWINKNNILFAEQPKQINIKIKDASQNRLIKDTQLAQTEEDSQKLLKLLKQSYKKAPYFDSTYVILEKLLTNVPAGLSEYLLYTMKELCTYLKIDTRLILSSNIQKNDILKGEEKIIDICKNRKADYYINAIGGKQLYHSERFDQEGIILKFIKTKNILYSQHINEFIPNLSIIDVMMFNSLEEIKKLLLEYILED